jgi:drug/metabolite transporter (DMT)-like permease
MRTDTRAYLELTGAMVLVGSSVVAGKLMAESLPVFLAGGLSSAIGAAILLPVLFAREGGLPVVGRREMLVLFLQAFTGIFLFRVLLLWGLLFTSAAEGGVITSTTPAVVGLISFLFLKERPGPRVWAGIILAVAGIVALNVLGSGAQGGGGRGLPDPRRAVLVGTPGGDGLRARGDRAHRAAKTGAGRRHGQRPARLTGFGASAGHTGP